MGADRQWLHAGLDGLRCADEQSWAHDRGVAWDSLELGSVGGSLSLLCLGTGATLIVGYLQDVATGAVQLVKLSSSHDCRRRAQSDGQDTIVTGMCGLEVRGNTIEPNFEPKILPAYRY